jgi:hypothetical protein
MITSYCHFNFPVLIINVFLVVFSYVAWTLCFRFFVAVVERTGITCSLDCTVLLPPYLGARSAFQKMIRIQCKKIVLKRGGGIWIFRDWSPRHCLWTCSVHQMYWYIISQLRFSALYIRDFSFQVYYLVQCTSGSTFSIGFAFVYDDPISVSAKLTELLEDIAVERNCHRCFSSWEC